MNSFRNPSTFILRFLLLSFCTSTAAAAAASANSSSFLRGGPERDPSLSVTQDAVELVEDHPVVYPPGYTNRTSSHRRLATASGRRTVLIIRVIASGTAPTVSANELRQAAFGSSGSLASQLRLCSAGVLNVVESHHGIKDLHITASANNIREMISKSQQQASQLGIGSLKTAANHILFVFPEQGSSYVAEAEIVGQYAWFNNKLAASHSVLVHEVGHNFGLDHGGNRGDEYGDYSGMMGRSTTTKGGPAMCYNAADHYRLGWFNGKRLDVGSGPRTVTIGAFVYSTSSSLPVVVKASGNIYFQYNLAAGHNSGTRAMANQVVIVKLLPNGHTEAQKGLNQGESWRDPSTGLTIQFCSKTSRQVTVGVNSPCGATTSNQNTIQSVTSNNAWGNAWGNPQPRPAPSFNFAPRPRPSPSFNFAPRPQPTGWNPTPTINLFNSLFSRTNSFPVNNPWPSTPSRATPSWSFSWGRGEVDSQND